jgi:hypothetical protein
MKKIIALILLLGANIQLCAAAGVLNDYHYSHQVDGSVMFIQNNRKEVSFTLISKPTGTCKTLTTTYKASFHCYLTNNYCSITSLYSLSSDGSYIHNNSQIEESHKNYLMKNSEQILSNIVNKYTKCEEDFTFAGRTLWCYAK